MYSLQTGFTKERCLSMWKTKPNHSFCSHIFYSWLCCYHAMKNKERQKLLWKFKLSFFSSGKKQQDEYRDMPDGFCQVLLIYWKVFRQRTCIFWIWSTLHTCEGLYALLRRCEEITVMQEKNHKMKNRLSTKNIKPCMFLERAFLLSM